MRVKVDKRPIGIFDSGVGGLTVAEKVLRLLPNEDIVYFGDTARVPYGNKSRETVTRFSKEIVNFLLKFRVKLIIVACNTVSSLSLKELRRSFSVPIIGVLAPGAREAVRRTKNGRIGVIGTEATVASGAYKKEIRSIDKKAAVIQGSCPLFVHLAENRWFDSKITRDVAEKYLRPVLKKNIDTLILGCTHYPLLKKVIQKTAGKGVKLIDSSTAAAKNARELLARTDGLKSRGRGKARFFASDNTEKFEDLAEIFLGKRVKTKRAVL